MICLPEISVTMSAAIAGRYLLPELSTSGSASVADDIGHDLPGGATQGNPDPAFIGTLEGE